MLWEHDGGLPEPFLYCVDCHVGYVLAHCKRQYCKRQLSKTGKCLHCGITFKNAELIRPAKPECEQSPAAVRNRLEWAKEQAEKQRKKRAKKVHG